jgi:hypothetical protein
LFSDELLFVSNQLQLLSAPELQKRSIGHALKLLHGHAEAKAETQVVLYVLGRTIEKGFDTSHDMPAFNSLTLHHNHHIHHCQPVRASQSTDVGIPQALATPSTCVQACMPAIEAHTPVSDNKRLPNHQQRTNG